MMRNVMHTRFTFGVAKVVAANATTGPACKTVGLGMYNVTTADMQVAPRVTLSRYTASSATATEAATVFSMTSTAEEVARGFDLTGKVALVTGGNSGLGQETARVLSLHGCRVVITSRRASAAEEAIQQMKAANADVTEEGLPAEGEVSYVTMDLADLDTVKPAVEAVLKQTKEIDYLILNAGIMAGPFRQSKQGLELQVGTNHFGHFALTQQLLPQLSRQPSRIVALSSTGHRLGPIDLEDMHFTKGREYDEWVAYGQSKLSNILFAKELHARGEGKWTAVSVHPGMISSTNLARDLPWYVPLLQPLFRLFPSVVEAQFGDGYQKTIPQGAATTLWATLRDGVQAGGYHANCAVKEPSNPQAFDEAMQKALWTKTEEQLVVIEEKGKLE